MLLQSNLVEYIWCYYVCTLTLQSYLYDRRHWLNTIASRAASACHSGYDARYILDALYRNHDWRTIA